MKGYTVVIIGSGFGGQIAAINLRKNGIDDFCILERRDFMGGTWCQNTYPGAAVDVQSPLYSLSFEPYKWSRMFAKQNELEEYTNYIIDKYKLREKTELNTEVTQIKWIESEHKWEIFTANNTTFKAQFIVNASGPLSNPFIPDFKGKDIFTGVSFHTNQWDNNYDYKNKKVAIIGSGASAIQIIPAIAPDVKELHVFQRTPHWVMPRPDFVFSKWQQKLLGTKPIYKLVRNALYWGLESRIIGFKYSNVMLNLLGGSKAKKHLQTIKDPELREKLTPNYTIGCKRVLLSNTLFPTYQRENVHLQTKEQGINEITQTGIITQDGQNIDLDLIIYSTGYIATDNVIPYPVIGKDNTELNEVWAEFPRAYLGTTVPRFPNFFIITGPNTGIGHTSLLVMMEAQMSYILSCIKKVKTENYNAIEVSEKAEDEYTTMIHKEMEKTVWKTGGCQSWYQSKSGHIIAIFPGFSFSYRALTKKVKEKHHLIY